MVSNTKMKIIIPTLAGEEVIVTPFITSIFNE